MDFMAPPMTRLLTFAAVAALLTPVAAYAADPIEGHWARGSMEIRIASCATSLCGTVVKASTRQQAKAERGSGTTLIGATLIRDIRPAGPGRYSAKVFVADKNFNARGTIHQVGHDRLDVKGCALFGLLCKSAQWTRVGH